MTERIPPMTVAETAYYLGTSERHIRRLIHERKIPFTRVGGKIRFIPAELDRYLDDNQVS